MLTATEAYQRCIDRELDPMKAGQEWRGVEQKYLFVCRTCLRDYSQRFGDHVYHCDREEGRGKSCPSCGYQRGGKNLANRTQVMQVNHTDVLAGTKGFFLRLVRAPILCSGRVIIGDVNSAKKKPLSHIRMEQVRKVQSPA